MCPEREEPPQPDTADPEPIPATTPPGPTELPYPDPGIEFDEPSAYQRLVIGFLDAEFDHTVREYKEANRKLLWIAKGVRNAPPASGHERLLRSVSAVTRAASDLNDSLLRAQGVVSEDYRRPEPPPLPDFAGAGGLLAFYEVAKKALTPEEDPSAGDLEVIRQALLYDADTRNREQRQRDQMLRRYEHRSRVAFDVAHERAAVADASVFSQAMLQHDGGRIAAELLLALKQSHLLIQSVERLRSRPVGEMLRRKKKHLDQERELLERSIVLSTLTFIVGNTAPWIFARDDEERRLLQDDPERRRRDPDGPMWSAPTPMWIARQVLLLSLYRRAHGFRLLGEHERSYNDYRKVQRTALFARPGISCSPEPDRRPRELSLDVLGAVAEYRIGELYRADHDYMRALVHLCNGHDRLLTAGVEPHLGALGVSTRREVRFPRIEVQLRLGKGSAFFETGAMKRALKWMVRAWTSLVVLIDPAKDPSRSSSTERQDDPFADVVGYLERVKHDRELDKELLFSVLKPAVNAMCEQPVPESYRAVAADILGKLGHLLMVIRLDPADGLADLCLRRAAGFDAYNLFVRTSLRRGELRAALLPGDGGNAPDAVGDGAPDALSCWPSGASDVDQAIRLAEHLMLNSLLEALRASGEGGEDAQVARALMGDFIAHTDSINLRLEVLNRYLMLDRDEKRRPERAEPPLDESYLEFVSLRRYGCYTPLLPRPASVSAVGGGYLVRLCSPTSDTSETAQAIFNILVDPGDGVVKNLYRVGLGIGDIDMVIATHDHPDHVGALDAIVSLREARGDVAPLSVLGNESVYDRYQGQQRQVTPYLIGNHADAGLPSGVSVKPLQGQHKDLANHDSRPFVLTFSPAGRASRSITFMSDTATRALGDYSGGRLTQIADEDWKRALDSDIVVAHVSDVSVGELHEIAGLRDVAEVERFNTCVKGLLDNGREEDAIRIARALSMLPASQASADALRGLLDPGSLADNKDAPHLYLQGLLAVANHMNESTATNEEGQPRVLVVGELREQLGSFRRTIAKEIQKYIFGAEGESVVALTADIGLRIRLDSGRRNRALCSICSMDNDRLDDERFHSPESIIEVCVKGDHEANYWLCPIHDPSQSLRQPMFIEQMGGYDPFASGDRYHG